jgi:macrodomain Ter protein organizer (MatP/YcbG family)
MDTKLTVKLDGNVISRAKIYARKRKTSLSKMIENYLDVVSKPEAGENEISPLVRSLSGVIKLPDNYEYKKEYAEFLTQKYS